MFFAFQRNTCLVCFQTGFKHRSTIHWEKFFRLLCFLHCSFNPCLADFLFFLLSFSIHNSISGLSTEYQKKKIFLLNSTLIVLAEIEDSILKLYLSIDMGCFIGYFKTLSIF